MSNKMGEIQLKTDSEKEVQFSHILNYQLFKEEFGEGGETELLSLEKFYATRVLVESGCSKIFVNATLLAQSSSGERDEMIVDVFGVRDEGFILAFCETAQPTLSLHEKLKFPASIDNVKIVLLYPFTVDVSEVLELVPPEVAIKVSIEQVPWLEDELERGFQKAMEFIGMLCNETRVKMLLPLLKQTKRKGEYRTRINPKLVYENIASLVEHDFLHEISRNEYTLTPIGSQILAEYLTFVQRIKKTLKEFER